MWTFAFPHPCETHRTSLAQGWGSKGDRQGVLPQRGTFLLQFVQVPGAEAQRAGSGGGWLCWGGLGTRCGRRFIGPGWTDCTDPRPVPGPGAAVPGWCVASAKRTRRGQRVCGWAHGLLREHRHRGRHAAPTGHPQAGPARRR